MCKHCTDFFVHSASKALLFHRAISELGENWGSLGEKKASRMGAERWRRAGNGAPLFFFIPQFFPQLGAIKQALRGLRCIFIAAAQRVGVYAQRDAGVGVAHARGDGHGVNVIRQQYGGMRMPLRYNYDKPEKPRISRVFGYLARFFILFQTEKSSREVITL